MLPVLRFTDSDYPFGVFKLSLEKGEGVIKKMIYKALHRKLKIK
jgi:hypothetical protein